MLPTTIGLDIAKNVFQVHGVDAEGRVVMRKRLRRVEVRAFFRKQAPCLVGIEACATCFFWARELIALGHEVKLMPAQYVKPYVKRSKTDAADAEAICEAVTRPTMRFVPIKTPGTQALGLLHRMRAQLIGQRVALVGSLRSGLAEFGITAADGKEGEKVLLEIAATGRRVPEALRAAYLGVASLAKAAKLEVAELDLKIADLTKSDDTCARLQTIPGIGPVTASMIVAFGGDLSRFKSGRHFAAWIGLTPRQKSSGGAVRLGRISKAGDKMLRSLLVIGAFTVIKQTKAHPERHLPWLRALLERRPALVATVALANKTARIAWALVVRGGTYQASHAA
jgi:transposase